MNALRRPLPPTVAAAAIVAVAVASFAFGDAFQPLAASSRRTGTALTAKKLKNKQFDLAKKWAELQKAKEEGGDSDGSLTDEEVKERNDRLRFEELLGSKSAGVLNDYSDDGYLNKEQEEEEIRAARSGADRIFEGDPAPTEPFENLVPAGGSNALGADGAKKVVPWLRPSSGASDYLVIVCDPREKSTYLQQTSKALSRELPADIQKRTIVVNADTPAENRRWLKKAELTNLDVYSDKKREWMQAYTALGRERWSMTMFVIANERVQRLARDLDPYAAIKVIKNAVQSLSNV